MIKLKSLYITILSILLPMAIGVAQDSDSAPEEEITIEIETVEDGEPSTDASSPTEEEATADEMSEMEEAVTVDADSVPEEAVDVGTIEADPVEVEVSAEEPIVVEEEVSVEGVSTEVEASSETEGTDETGITVKAVESDETMTEAAVVTEEIETTIDEPELDAPALEIDLPEEGEMKLEFPTDVDTEADLSMGDDETISVDFPDEEVRTIIRNVADLYDLNVVIPDTLVGSTSIKLRNVTWRQVFEVVLDPLGYTYVEDRNIIKIRGRDELAQEPVDTRVFLINYAVASQLQGSLAPLVDAAAGGRIQVDKRTNALIITERPSRMNDVQEIIERLDRPNAQVMIESKFVEITNRDQENIGINWSSLNSYQVSAGPFDREYTRTSGSTRTSDNAQDSTNTDTDSTSVTDNNGVIDEVIASVDSRTNDLTGSSTDTFTDVLSRADTALFNAQSFNVILSALQTLSDVRLVSNPTVVTLDGEDALIAIGERFPIPDYQYNDERGTFEVSGFTYQDIGINLKVRPQVNSAGFIRLSITPEVSSRAGEVSFGGDANAVIPIIASRRTESEVTLKDGYTLAIGGLIESQVTDGNSSVPYLSDIPYLGRLFRSDSQDVTMRNLIIFVTAKTLNPDGTTYREIIDPRVIHSMGLSDADIPGYKLPDEEVDAIDEIQRVRNEAARIKTQLEYEQILEQLRADERRRIEKAEAAEKPHVSRAR